MFITSRPATAIIIALAAFLIVSLALACSSAPAQRTAAPPAAPPAGRVSAAAPSQLITPVVVLPTPTAIPQPTPRADDVNTDRAALAALYNATNGSSWQDDTNWLSNGPLGEWHGVSTDADGRVADLRLDGKQLSGSILAELGNLYNLVWCIRSSLEIKVRPTPVCHSASSKNPFCCPFGKPRNNATNYEYRTLEIWPESPLAGFRTTSIRRITVV